VTSGLTHAIDTVERAAATPDQPQPFRELGLKDDEYQRIRDILGRRPTDAELAMYSVMWSEHCSYKSSKVHLRYFGETTTDEMRAGMLAGIGENAGVVDIGDGWAVTFKVESHNHPSYVEPYQGAATGVGGIVRDIMAMGARPVAVMDQLRFGAADAPDTRRVLDGVVRGIGGYGNSLGLPNIGGETVFDACYAGNPLVNALCVGVLRKEDLHLAFASGTGNKIILFGARTGLDGIGGVSVLASETFGGDESGSGRKKLPSVQVGDPFTEKVLIECCLELYSAGLVIGIQDLGGAGLSCATSELASAGDGGMAIELDTVPLRAKDMTPAEILSSESQERMCAVVAPENVDAFMAVCRKWEVLATTIGEVTDGDRLQITWHGATVVDVPPRTVAHEGPIYQRPVARPESQDALIADTTAGLKRPVSGDELRATLLALLGSPHLCSRAFITEQYDRYVRGNTVLAEHADGGVLRVDETTGRGVAVSTDASGRYTLLDPYVGAQLALAEAYRNVAVTGATPVAVTNCLNFGSPEDPGVMWQFSEAVRGLADGCVALGIPVTGGNVSFYNQTGTTAIMPTPLSIWAGGPPRSTWLASDCWPTCSAPPRVTGWCPRPMTCPKADWPRRSWSRRWPAKPVVASCFPRMPTRSSRCSPNHPAGCWWRCHAPRRAASRRCARRGACPPPGSASWTRARTRSRFRACSRCHWRSCAARPKGCWPPSCDERRTSRTPSAAGVGVGPAAAEVRRRAVRRAVLLFVVDAVAGTARVVVPGPD
jgi:phosphoribosylformylglycinamidine synthase II